MRRDVQLSKRSAYAAGTRSNLKTQWRAYFLFALHFGLQPLPASLDNLCLFAQFLSRSLKAIQSIRAYLSAVRTLHLFLDIPCEFSKQFVLNLTLRGIARLHPHTPNQKLPISPDILLQLFGVLDMRTQLDLTLWTSFLFAFFLCARKSNIIVPSLAKFDPQKHLCRSDVTLTPLGLNVLIRWSKTIQAGERFLIIPLLPIPNSPLCPVKAYRTMLRFIPAEESGPAFVYRTKSASPAPLTHAVFASRLAVALGKIGLDPGLYSGHSFRRGGATWAFSSGFPVEAIKLLGDWRSDAFMLYIHLSYESRLSLAEKLRDSLAHYAN